MKEYKNIKKIIYSVKENLGENEAIGNRQFLSNSNVDEQVGWASPVSLVQIVLENQLSRERLKW
jgi:hypothetical protein